VPTFLAPPVSGHYEKCEVHPSEQCLCVDSVNPYFSELADNEVLDYVSKTQTESCTLNFELENPFQDCDTKFAAKSCTDGYSAINNHDLLEVYCAKNIMKIDGKKLVNSESKKAIYDAAELIKSQLNAAKEIAKKAQACGQDTLALMLVRNAPKALSNAQKIQLVTNTEMISKLLQLGSLDAAKAEILAAEADGALITEGDKTALAANIDSCKP
jgi:hypothetical protein